MERLFFYVIDKDIIDREKQALTLKPKSLVDRRVYYKVYYNSIE